MAEARCRDWGSFLTLRLGRRRHSQPLDHGLILHYAGLGEHPPRSTDLCYAHPEFRVAQLFLTLFYTSIEQDNSSWQPIPPNGFHPTEITSL